MADTTETGRGSRPWEQGEMAKAPGEMRGTWPNDHRRAFVDGVAWWEYTKTEGTLWQSDRRMAETEACRRFPDDDSQSRRGTGRIATISERPPMIVEDDESEWMVDLREMADPMIPHNWESRAPTTRKAIDHIEAQEKEIVRLKAALAEAKANNDDPDDDDPDDAACSPAEFLRTLLKRTEQAESALSYEQERNANNVACAEAERRFPDADPAPPERTCRWTCIPYVLYKSPAMWRAACKWEQPDFSSRPRGMYCPGCGGMIVQAGTKPDPVPAETRRTCKWTLTGDRWVAGCGSTPAPDIPPPTSCECGGLVITEEFSQSEKDLHGQPAVAQDDEPEWMQTLREQAKREYPPEYHYHGEIQLATAARSALAEIEAQEKEIARLTDLNTFFLSNALAIARGKKEE